jgi:hypothetical protein
MGADAAPLTVPILSYDYYLDPPVGGPVIGVSVPTFSVARAAMMIATIAPSGTTATTSICKNVTTSLTSGNHTISASAVDAGGKSVGSTPAPFAFLGIPSAPPSNLTFK